MLTLIVLIVYVFALIGLSITVFWASAAMATWVGKTIRERERDRDWAEELRRRRLIVSAGSTRTITQPLHKSLRIVEIDHPLRYKKKSRLTYVRPKKEVVAWCSSNLSALPEFVEESHKLTIVCATVDDAVFFKIRWV